jgi:hypothetical protein
MNLVQSTLHPHRHPLFGCGVFGHWDWPLAAPCSFSLHFHSVCPNRAKVARKLSQISALTRRGKFRSALSLPSVDCVK